MKTLYNIFIKKSTAGIENIVKFEKNLVKIRTLRKIFVMERSKSKKNTKKSDKKTLFSVLTGCLAGFINGLFGGGGGMIVVPMLTNFLFYKQKNAHATAILIILPLSIVSGLLYLSFGSMRLSVGIPVAIGVIVGGTIGAILLSKLSSKWVALIFYFLMAAAGVKMLIF